MQRRRMSRDLDRAGLVRPLATSSHAEGPVREGGADGAFVNAAVQRLTTSGGTSCAAPMSLFTRVIGATATLGVEPGRVIST